MWDDYDRRALDRLMGKCTEDEAGCWVWKGSAPGGQNRRRSGARRYGDISYRGRQVVVHRLAYSLMVADIPDGLELDHLCRNTLCVRPDHLEPVTGAENLRRAALARSGGDAWPNAA
ncbi:HNH endonuclease signature motif containing protein [Streptomyces sp. CC224B]|uniref:HNH endonuclease signature motif containing protein n=1 Tax=Streptomyces sp. CC224B TaxID=3044571 RepID=UPI0024A9960E|nr:HNH endonuclease signature motif containing protein [Streptomyces sp. CC224B]